MDRILFTYHSGIKLLSFFLIVAYLLERLFLPADPDVASDLPVALAAAGAVVILLPVSGESVRESFLLAVLCSAMVVLFGAFVSDSQALIPFLAVFVSLSMLLRMKQKYRRVRMLFRNEEVMRSLEDNARWTYVSLWFVLCSFQILSHHLGVGFPAVTAAFGTFYIVMLLRSFLGENFFVARGKEDMIRKIIKGSLRPANVMTGDEEEMARKARLYEKVQQVMETKRPFLDEDFSLQDLSTLTFTNRTYLSKTINVISGRNFCQFVNYYRVMYSLELIKQDCHLRVSELSAMSGFHTVVTYNMAFKMYMNETPSGYVARARLNAGSIPSSFPGQAP